ncbi:hypothetical protein BC831DRAFT_509609 [Entophlyctis helioformis]|nr:hypothetical protein BC831DRAFT_509609 [Entophlyctis helioformis]
MSAQAELASSQKAADVASKELLDARSQILQLESTIAELTTASDFLMQTLNEKDAALKIAQEQHAAQTPSADLTELHEKLAAAQAALLAKEELVATLTTKADQLAAEAVKSEARVAELDHALSSVALKDQAIADLSLKVESVTAALATAEASLATQRSSDDQSAVSAAEAHASEVHTLRQALAAREHEKSTIFSRLATSESRLAEALQGIQELEAALHEASATKAMQPHTVSQEDIQQLEEESAHKDMLIESMRNQLQEMVNDMDAQIVAYNQLAERLAQAESAFNDKSVLRTCDSQKIRIQRLEQQGLANGLVLSLPSPITKDGLDSIEEEPEEEDAASPLVTANRSVDMDLISFGASVSAAVAPAAEASATSQTAHEVPASPVAAVPNVVEMATAQISNKTIATTAGRRSSASTVAFSAADVELDNSSMIGHAEEESAVGVTVAKEVTVVVATSVSVVQDAALSLDHSDSASGVANAIDDAISEYHQATAEHKDSTAAGILGEMLEMHETPAVPPPVFPKDDMVYMEHNASAIAVDATAAQSADAQNSNCKTQ